MIVINTEEDIKQLKLNESYILGGPLDPIEFIEFLEKIQPLIDKHIESLLNNPIDKDFLKKTYPNKTAIRKLKEPEAVELGKLLGLATDVNLLATKNDKLLIDYFTKNIW